MLETFFNFIFCISSPGPGWYPEMSTGGVAVGGVGLLVFPNGLNREIKFVPWLFSPGAVVPWRKYKNPNTAIITMIRIIIKSIKFLFDI